MSNINEFKSLPAAVRQRILNQYVEMKANQYLFNNQCIDYDRANPNRFIMEKEWFSLIEYGFNYEEHLKAHIDQSAEEELL